MESPLIIVAAFTWLATLYEFRSVVKRRSVVVTWYWLALLFISIGITVRVSAVSAGIDALLRLPHASHVMSNACAILALLAVQCAVYSGLVSPKIGTSLRVFAGAHATVTLIVMALLFLASSPLEPADAAWRSYDRISMALYRLSYLAFMGTAFALSAFIWARHTFTDPGRQLKVAFALMTVGGVIGFLYVLNGLGVVLRESGLSPGIPWGDQGQSDLIVSFAIVMILLGATSPTWMGIGDALRKHLQFLRLRRLWLQLAEACPQVILLPTRPLWRDALDVRGADFRLRRQVTEIRDGRMVLSRRAWPEAEAVARAEADGLEVPAPERVALIEAALLWTAMQSDAQQNNRRSSPQGSQSAIWRPMLETGDLAAEVKHLVRVARHMRGSTAFLRVLDALASNRMATTPV